MRSVSILDLRIGDVILLRMNDASRMLIVLKPARLLDDGGKYMLFNMMILDEGRICELSTYEDGSFSGLFSCL